MPPVSPLTKITKDLLAIEYVSNSSTVGELLQKYSISSGHLYKILSDLGIPKRGEILFQVDEILIEDLFRSGNTIGSIVEISGSSRNTVRKTISKIKEQAFEKATLALGLEIKWCNGCNEYKELSDFNNDLSKKDKKATMCRECKSHRASIGKPRDLEKKRISNAKWRAKNQDKIKASQEKRREDNPLENRAYQLKKYGLTLEDYLLLCLKQNNLCQICLKPETVVKNGKPQLLCVDHCHKTGKVRGLLCGKCNTALGKFKDDEKILARAIQYIRCSKDA